MPRTPLSPAVEDMLTMAPPPLSSMAGISYFMQRKTPRRLTRTARSKSSTATSASGAGMWPSPALLKAASRRPQASRVCATRRSTEAGSPTSVGTASAWPPEALMSSATAARACSSRAASTTVAPAAAKVRTAAAPMPRLAPVMMATLPVRSGLVGAGVGMPSLQVVQALAILVAGDLAVSVPLGQDLLGPGGVGAHSRPTTAHYKPNRGGYQRQHERSPQPWPPAAGSPCVPRMSPPASPRVDEEKPHRTMRHHLL